MRLRVAGLALMVAAAWCSCTTRTVLIDPAPPEAWSLLRDPLYPPDLPRDRREALEGDLAAAKSEYDHDPASEDAIIWYGRRLAYLGRYQEAIRVFERGLEIHPESVRLRRHLGHRCITVRRFDDAVRVLREAAELVRGVPDEIEPDGAPNALNIPRSTTQSNIWYHLGLAHFLLGEYEDALAAYQECLKVSANDDMWCATAHWTWMTLKRLGRHEEARRLLEPLGGKTEIIENQSYHALLRLYARGERPSLTHDPLLVDENEPTAFPSAEIVPEHGQVDGARSADAAFAYGVANWFIVHGEEETGLAVCRGILHKGEWPAFGHIAAEADLARLGR